MTTKGWFYPLVIGGPMIVLAIVLNALTPARETACAEKGSAATEHPAGARSPLPPAAAPLP